MASSENCRHSRQNALIAALGGALPANTRSKRLALLGASSRMASSLFVVFSRAKALEGSGLESMVGMVNSSVIVQVWRASDFGALFA